MKFVGKMNVIMVLWQRHKTLLRGGTVMKRFEKIYSQGTFDVIEINVYFVML